MAEMLDGCDNNAPLLPLAVCLAHPSPCGAGPSRDLGCGSGGLEKVVAFCPVSTLNPCGAQAERTLSLFCAPLRDSPSGGPAPTAPPHRAPSSGGLPLSPWFQTA